MPNSLVDILRERAIHQPYRLAYRFLRDGEFDEQGITYQTLDERARSIAALLQDTTQEGDRVLLLLPASLDFIIAFLGCLYAKVLPIPLTPPHALRLEKSLEATLRIAADAEPTAALLHSSLFSALQAKPELVQELGQVKLLPIDDNLILPNADQWSPTEQHLTELAFLQYTSGSTHSPKGVMVTHGNLLHNLGFIENTFGLSKKTKSVFWLPPYHDMGLIGGILQALFSGYPLTFLPHLLFIQRPIRWLQAMTRFRATTSAGPNFAYDLCVRKIKPEQRAELDLSHWKVAINGAEPIYHQSLERFAQYFAPCGFRREAFAPSYGLAEATLMVSGGPMLRVPTIKQVEKSALSNGAIVNGLEAAKNTQWVVGCGQKALDQDIKIVDPDTMITCIPKQVGEVWVRGGSVATGYWNNQEETEAVFGAYLADTQEGPYLRTGDLGFMEDGELYITGRRKNLIIVEGRNHYPHDIERSVEDAHPVIRPEGSAAFSVEREGSEGVVILAEIAPKEKDKAGEVKRLIRSAIATNHALKVSDIRLLLPGGIPRTTSGKKRRFQCKQLYLANTIKEIPAS